MKATEESPEPEAIVCPNCGKEVVPRVVPDADPSARVTRDVAFGNIGSPPETAHFHAECPICHHPLFAKALEKINLETEKGFDWQMLILSLVALAALVALALTMGS